MYPYNTYSLSLCHARAQTNQSDSKRLITGCPSADGPEHIVGNCRTHWATAPSRQGQMPSAIELWDEKQRAFEAARYTLDSYAVNLNEIADFLKKRDDLLKPDFRHPYDDSTALQRLLEKEWAPLTALPDFRDLLNAIQNLNRANSERDEAYKALSQIEKRYVDVWCEERSALE